ncbi:sulfotransferase domain-containing protein [Jannaschia seohaensis]|uniref:Sulfotransferase domain-containing protein n=1 Tax=Jannaschia seohaensis TaxID=475081 RepID=A0A2Y9BW31_9RHOB|nr:sulfotransferase domain-containing protein [Jannaschia seohaensis]PWJ22094.1 sulfotransferase domain-containing protein [Jannaschia seohaensis]SSA38372.1 Sulfotransferase domain-containing protein [Jannaschia seohaensis]
MSDLIAPRIFCVGTHHKTGTLWMRAVFRRLATRLGVEKRVVFPSTRKRIPPRERIFLFSWSSTFPDDLLARPDARILHVIRDPRDVLLSGMRYHRHAPVKGEQFLHVPRDDLAGRTYQEHLNALPDDLARLRFEMDEKHALTLSEMLAWDYTAPNRVETRYEDLIADVDCTLFRDRLRNLGLTEPEVAMGVEIFWKNALFGGLARPEDRIERVAKHVASGRAGQWRTRLPRPIAEAYAERYGEALVTLGYAEHPTRWLSDLRAEA